MTSETPPMARLLLTLALICLLAACRFEAGDTAFVPQTVASYVLYHDSTAGNNHLLRYRGIEGQLDWQQTVGMAPATLGGIDGEKEDLWLGSNQPGQVLRLDAVSGLLAQTYPVGELRSHFLAVGEAVLMLSDTVAQQAGLLSREGGALVTFDLPLPPGQPLYRGGQFYLPVGREVWVFQAQARAILAKVALDYPVVDLQHDQRSTIWVYTAQGDTLWKAGLEYHNHLLTDPPEPNPGLVKERYSPYRQVNYGTERTTTVRLTRNGGLGALRGVIDFEYDFFEQTTFYRQQDTLWRSSLSHHMTRWGDGRGIRLLRSVHVQAQAEAE